MRLAAQAKMGYYPTPESVTLIIVQYLKRKSDGLIRILDPCAGEGTALQCIGNHLQAESYGIEIDTERGNKAKKILTKCLITDYRTTRISHNSFSLLWLNPPYDWASRESELEISERYERIFLRDCIPYLCKKGILIYLIPQHRLDIKIAQILSYRFEQLQIFKFPEKEYKAFKQLIIFGVLKKIPAQDDKTTDFLNECGKFNREIPFIPQQPSQLYEVPLSPLKSSLLFRSQEIDPKELSEEIQQHGIFFQVKEILMPLQINERIKPVMPLRYGHLAQILACGLMNGVVFDHNQENPLLVKGITKKEIIHEVEIQGETEKHIETDKIKIIINAFNLDGELLVIQ